MDLTTEIQILAGGESRRMGKAKALLRLGGRTLMEIIQESAAQTGWPYRVIQSDLIPGQGPLGGIHTAFVESRADQLIFLSCDMPFLTSESICQLPEALGEGTQAVFMKSPQGYGFPFLLRRTLFPEVEQALKQGLRSLQRFARSIRSARIDISCFPERDFFNINTPGDYAEAQALWRLQGKD